LGQRHGRLIGETARRERQLVELRLERGNQPRVAVAQMVHAIAVKIHISPAVEVLEPQALGAPHG
jgi:hypothetical protein